MTSFQFPEISDSDIKEAAVLLGLDENAFHGEDGNDSRARVFKCKESLDIEACPGSGKTTLLVAKLAVLAAKWNSSRCGICVLSHTNVARQEVEARVGGTRFGTRLLTYPHFVGTIHSFVNEFIASPWLRSQGVRIKTIDDEVTLNLRWSRVTAAIRSGLERNRHSKETLRVRDVNYGVGPLSWSRGGTLNENSPTYTAIRESCRTTSEEGFFCHAEMLLWAKQALVECPYLRTALQRRFPLVFIDEVQDNSEEQSSLLADVFVGADSSVIRQRFGDSNQAIYDHDARSPGATTDEFPQSRIRDDITNSYRFGQRIADLTDPLGLSPQGLVGCGPGSEDRDGGLNRCAVLLFDESDIEWVIANYGQLLISTFSSDEIVNGVFTAVGAVHRDTGNDHIPRSVTHYWTKYRHESGKGVPRLRVASRYVCDCLQIAHSSRHSRSAVSAVAEVVVKLAELSNSAPGALNRRRPHLALTEALSESPSMLSKYRRITAEIAVRSTPMSRQEWESEIAPAIREVASQLTTAELDGSEVDAFLSWADSDGIRNHEQSGIRGRDNVYEFKSGETTVPIQLGSIHSVKGETHTATLVLETYYRAHDLKSLKRWLLGTKSGVGAENNATRYRLKQHFVAMTRPRHLLCLAMRKDSFTSNEVTRLKSRWRVGIVAPDGPQWSES